MVVCRVFSGTRRDLRAQRPRLSVVRGFPDANLSLTGPVTAACAHRRNSREQQASILQLYRAMRTVDRHVWYGRPRDAAVLGAEQLRSRRNAQRRFIVSVLVPVPLLGLLR